MFDWIWDWLLWALQGLWGLLKEFLVGLCQWLLDIPLGLLLWCGKMFESFLTSMIAWGTATQPAEARLLWSLASEGWFGWFTSVGEWLATANQFFPAYQLGCLFASTVMFWVVWKFWRYASGWIPTIHG